VLVFPAERSPMNECHSSRTAAPTLQMADEGLKQLRKEVGDASQEKLETPQT
jgi:hypothetical protein